MNTTTIEGDDDDLAERRNALAQFAGIAPAPRGDEERGEINVGAEAGFVGAQPVAVRRNLEKVIAELKVLGQAAGADWYYRFPVKNRREGTTDWIEGPSIKLANDLARQYGNCAVETGRIIDQGNAWLIYARFIDVETGYALTRPFRQAKGAARIGGDDADRKLDIALQIGVSKAIRNVTCNALQTLADFAFEQAKNSLVERIGKKLPDWKARIRERFAEIPLDIRRVEAVIGKTVDEMLAADIARVVAMKKAVDDGMATLADTFPPLVAAAGEEAVDPATGELAGFAGPPAGATAGPKPAEAEKPAAAAEAPGKPATAEVAKPAATAPAEAAKPAGAPPAPATAAVEAAAAPAEQRKPPTEAPAPASHSAEELDRARLGGQRARTDGRGRRQMPADIKASPALSRAWLAGFDGDEREPGEEG